MSAEAAPAINHPDRDLYRWVSKTGQHVLKTSFSLDAGIRALQAYAIHKPNRVSLDFNGAIEKMERQAYTTLEQHHKDGLSSWNEYYRLISKAAFLEQSILAPFLFEDPLDLDVIERITDSLYGINGDILDHELHNYDAQHNRRQRAELIGAIQEQTVPALLHRPEDQSVNRFENKWRLVLPAETGDDLRRRTDLSLWRRADNLTPVERIPIQVKSFLHRGETEQDTTPDGGITITAADFGNADLTISRLIVKELALRHPGGLSAHELATLNHAKERLVETIDYKLNQNHI
jgi:hypothetical protein